MPGGSGDNLGDQKPWSSRDDMKYRRWWRRQNRRRNHALLKSQNVLY